MPKPKSSRKIIKQDLMWPTPLWHTQIWEFMRSQTRVTFNEDFTSWILGVKEKEKSVRKSNRGGWQSELYKPDNEMFKPLINEIKEFCLHLPLNIKKTYVEQLWANVNTKGDWNAIHQHGSYHLSGTYYVKVPEDSGRIVFRDPRPGAVGSVFHVNRFDKGEFKRLNLIEGLLAIWPSYLDHFVEPSQTDEERISISFDIYAE
tara:strand:- start:197 stop:805 length:609 start_codon:yes stop_codon:yes gene_type:complete